MPTSNDLTLPEYWDKLSTTDWHYDYSDDPGVWRRGEEEMRQNRVISKQSPEHLALFAKFQNGEKPERPSE